MNPDPLDQSRDFFVDGLIDQAIEKKLESVEILDKSIPEAKRKEWEAILKANFERHMAEKGRLLKQRIQGALDNDRTKDWPFENGRSGWVNPKEQ